MGISIDCSVGKLAEDLMVLHCQECEGTHCGYTGCSVGSEIIDIIQKHIKETS